MLSIRDLDINIYKDLLHHDDGSHPVKKGVGAKDLGQRWSAENLWVQF